MQHAHVLISMHIFPCQTKVCFQLMLHLSLRFAFDSGGGVGDDDAITYACQTKRLSSFILILTIKTHFQAIGTRSTLCMHSRGEERRGRIRRQLWHQQLCGTNRKFSSETNNDLSATTIFAERFA